MKHLNAKDVTDHITSLLLSFPELKDDDVLRADMVEGSTPTPEFLGQILTKINEAKAMYDALDVRVKELEKRRDRFDGRIIGLRSLIMKIMGAADLKSMQLPEATLTVKHGVAKVIITDEKLIPAIFCRIKKEPDKKLIKAELEVGNIVPGCTLSNGEATLAIST